MTVASASRRPLQGVGRAPGAMLLALGAAWGLQFTLLKVASDGAGAEVAPLAMVTGALALVHLGGLAALGGRYRPTVAQLRFFFTSGFFGIALPLGALLYAARELSAGMIVLIESLCPITTLALSVAMGREPMRPQRALAVALGVASAAVACRDLASAGDAALTEALSVAMIAPVSYAVNAVQVSRDQPAELTVRQTAAGEATASAAMALPALLLLGGAGAFAAPAPAAGAAIAAIVAAGFAESWLYFRLLRTESPSFVSLASCVSLIAGVLWGMTLLGEQHPPSFWVAAGLAAAALAAGVSGERR